MLCAKSQNYSPNEVAVQDVAGSVGIKFLKVLRGILYNKTHSDSTYSIPLLMRGIREYITMTSHEL